MGFTLFHVPQPDRLTASAIRQCYMQGIDAIPWQSKNTFEGEQLTIQRASSESGSLYIPWPVAGRGCTTLSTTCLRESETPYNLPVELARGTVGRLRNQIATWKHMGIRIPDDVESRAALATTALSRAATSQQRVQVASQAAEEAIVESMDTIDLLMHSFSEYALQKAGKRNVFLAANLGPRSGNAFPQELLGTINTSAVPFSWRDVEGGGEEDSLEFFTEQVSWSRRLGLRICGGPLLNLDRNGFPDWLYLWEEDAESLQSYMLRYVESIVKKFAGRVNLWHAWAGLNSGTAMNLSEEFRLRLGVAALEALRQIDPNTPAFVSFSQPFGEYMSRQALDLAPIHYADTLVRSDLGLSGLGLEINLGYWPLGTLPRDVLEISRLIDRWSSLGLPLVMILTLPSQADEPGSESDVSIYPTGTEEINEAAQARVAGELIRACLAKPAVQGVIWNQLADGDSTPVCLPKTASPRNSCKRCVKFGSSSWSNRSSSRPAARVFRPVRFEPSRWQIAPRRCATLHATDEASIAPDLGSILVDVNRFRRTAANQLAIERRIVCLIERLPFCIRNLEPQFPPLAWRDQSIVVQFERNIR